MDMFEPGAQSAAINVIFADYRAFLPDFLSRVQEYQRAQPGVIEPAGQFTHGRLDESLHPFCIGWAGDMRITTRYCEDETTQAVMGLIHETGHAL